MDMDTGEMDYGTDYSDFQYQHVTLTPENSGNFLFEIEPLQGRAGLDNNEVAELVHLEVQASMEFETESNDQDVGASAELRGTVSINLDRPNGLNGIGNELIEQVNETQSGFEAVDDRILQLFTARGTPAFDDETNGPGGASHDSGMLYENHYRDVTARGPVLDSTDDVTINGSLITGDTLDGVVRGNVRITMIWDVAEVSDAGRAFSVPN